MAEQVPSVNCLSSCISYNNVVKVNYVISRFNFMCGIIKWFLNMRTRKDTQKRNSAKQWQSLMACMAVKCG